MQDLSDLPEFTPAGRANILMSIARLSGGAYIEPPQDVSKSVALKSFILGMIVAAVIVGGVGMVS